MSSKAQKRIGQVFKPLPPPKSLSPKAQTDPFTTQELTELTTTLPNGISSITLQDDDLFRWDIQMLAPSDSSYAGGKFKLLLSIPQEYPFKPPSLRFLTPIYHPNITNDGSDPLATGGSGGPAATAAAAPGPGAGRFKAVSKPLSHGGAGASSSSSAAAAAMAGAGNAGGGSDLPPGSMCLAMLKQDNWKPASRIRAVLESAGNILREPNTDDAVEGDVAEVYGRDRKEFDRRAQGWVAKFASK